MTTPGPFILHAGHHQQEILIHNTQRVVYRFHNEGPNEIRIEWGGLAYELAARQSIDIDIYHDNAAATQVLLKLKDEKGLATGWFDRVDRIGEQKPQRP